MSDTPETHWCLIGNIANEIKYGSDGETRHGTPHFSPGTKVYCFPALWGDGFESIKIIARHRGSKRFVKMIISSRWVTNWRAKVVYDPVVLRLFREEFPNTPEPIWQSKEEVDEYVSMLKDREIPPRPPRPESPFWLIWPEDNPT